MFGDTAGPSKGAAMQDYEPVSYNYSWFHFIFSLASMYIAMLMTGVTLLALASCNIFVTWFACTSPSLALRVGSHAAACGCCAKTLLLYTDMRQHDILLLLQPDDSTAVGWGMGAEEKDLLDVGWFSVWVKLVSLVATACLYLWVLAAPAIFPERSFS